MSREMNLSKEDIKYIKHICAQYINEQIKEELEGLDKYIQRQIDIEIAKRDMPEQSHNYKDTIDVVSRYIEYYEMGYD